MQVKINIDGGSRGNPGPGAAAYVVCNKQGKLLSQEGHFIAHCTNNQAEYTALKLALLKCNELGATELFIESDSLLLVKQFTGEYKIKNADLQARMQVIRLLAQRFTIHIKHVLRQFNKAPDALANQAMDAKKNVGTNPINYLPKDEEILAGTWPKPAAKKKTGKTAPAKNIQKTRPAKPGAKKPQAPAKPVRFYQPDLFE